MQKRHHHNLQDSVAIGKGELSATRVVVGIGDESPSASVFTVNPGYIVGGAFEVSGGEGGCARADCGCDLLDESESGDGEDAGKVHRV